MNTKPYYLTLIILFSFLLLAIFTGAFGYMTGILEDTGRGAKNIINMYNSERIESSDSRQSKEGGVLKDSSTDSDPDISVLAFSTVTATITAYTSDPAETDDTPCISASRVNICKSKMNIIACPRKYDFMTRVEIENKQYFCLDRMGTEEYRNGDYFDIYFGMDKQGALIFGRQTLEVKIYNN